MSFYLASLTLKCVFLISKSYLNYGTANILRVALSFLRRNASVYKKTHFAFCRRRFAVGFIISLDSVSSAVASALPIWDIHIIQTRANKVTV